LLTNELSDLYTDDFDVELLGFEANELESLLGLEPDKAEIVEDEVPEPPADPVTQPGDLWLLGDHRLLCGDSTKAEDVARLMDGKRADALLTDPPYGIDAANMKLGSGKKHFARGDWDKERPDIIPFIEMCNISIVWGGNYFANNLPITNDWLCWHKKNDGRSFSEFELAWSNAGFNCRHLQHHWSGEVKTHPTQKPLPVIAWSLSLIQAGKVLDPYLGSGTTLIAAEQLNRKCYGMEISPQYCDVIIQRWEKLTGNKAKKE
jgi:DNA modification methylase